jgi:hypothetical protein
MSAATARRTARKTSPERQQALEARKADIEQAAEAVSEDAPDFAAFLARWGDRYNVNNLRRLWVQAPGATCLHKYGTWQSLGRQVRRGESAILLMQPRISTDPDRVSADNPDGRVFHGASWMALFDFAQTDPVGEFTEGDGEADAALVAEAKRLKMAAAALHPDRGGDPADFMAAWALYEVAAEQIKAQRQARP